MSHVCFLFTLQRRNVIGKEEQKQGGGHQFTVMKTSQKCNSDKSEIFKTFADERSRIMLPLAERGE